MQASSLQATGNHCNIATNAEKEKKVKAAAVLGFPIWAWFKKIKMKKVS